MCAEASTVLRAVVEDFFFNCLCMNIPSDNCIQHIQRCVHYHVQSFQLKAFKDFYVGSPYWCQYCFIYEKFNACGEFDLCPSNQHILVRVIPSYFHFAKMCFCQVSLLSRCAVCDGNNFWCAHIFDSLHIEQYPFCVWALQILFCYVVYILH
jgi:hypothetical protein